MYYYSQGKDIINAVARELVLDMATVSFRVWVRSKGVFRFYGVAYCLLLGLELPLPYRS